MVEWNAIKFKDTYSVHAGKQFIENCIFEKKDNNS